MPPVSKTMRVTARLSGRYTVRPPVSYITASSACFVLSFRRVDCWRRWRERTRSKARGHKSFSLCRDHEILLELSFLPPRALSSAWQYLLRLHRNRQELQLLVTLNPPRPRPSPVTHHLLISAPCRWLPKETRTLQLKEEGQTKGLKRVLSPSA